ncbi:hypothetical protein [Buttiauxella agrestis]|uniref:hypothetical protein n=1 Tax=Buttiauxella agrestis TaxID=82977 RepID=UPI00155FCBC4|nr:hypothetical protein [Buttiauxella agrestis]BCG08772.1 hypothetical protein BADSM9389_14310 [Buttiauxella agrestis]
MQNTERLNVKSVLTALRNGMPIDIGAANPADVKRLRYHAEKAGFKIAVARLGASLICSANGAITLE